jgi:hypothetical protein
MAEKARNSRLSLEQEEQLKIVNQSQYTTRSGIRVGLLSSTQSLDFKVTMYAFASFVCKLA